ncbi:MAG: NADPH-dependent FMN reductase [Solirubrobacterales bacterium]
MKVLGISGSLRRNSHNSRLLRAAAELLPPGAELEQAGIADLPLYSEDLDTDPAPAPVRRLRDAIASADAIVISTPEYNASIPGGLKNAIDWASRPFPENAFKGKPVLVIGASTGLFGAVWAQAEVRKVLNHIGAEVLDSELPFGQAHEALDDDGIGEQAISAELENQLAVLVAQARDETLEPARDEALEPAPA